MRYIAAVTFLFVFVLSCAGQTFQIVRSDSTVFKSISINQYASVVTANRSYAGQLVSITADAITINHQGKLADVLIRDISKAKKTSKFGIGVARLSTFAPVVPILFLPSANSETYQGRTWAGRFVSRAAIIIPVSVAIGLLMNAPSFKKIKKGYSFKVT